jgi:hypothetical protein
MNHVIVAELLAEDALLIDLARELERIRPAGDLTAIQKTETKLLKHSNLRNLIIAEMEKAELALYELQRDHSTDELHLTG